MNRLGFVAVLIFWMVCQGWAAPAAGPKLDPVTLALRGPHRFVYAGYYAAIAKGYYRDAGLEVRLREPRKAEDSSDLVLRGEAQFGVGGSDILILRRGGKQLVPIAVIFQHSQSIILARSGNQNRPVNTVQDLARKVVMIDPSSADLWAYLKAEGIDKHSLNAMQPTHDVDELVHGRITAMGASILEEPFFLQKEKIEHMAFSPRAAGIDFYGDNLFTTETELNSNPIRTRAFRTASLKGWEYALSHPEEIVQLILDKYSTTRSREQLNFEAARIPQLITAGVVELGHMEPGRWRHIVDIYADYDLVPRSMKLGGAFTEPLPNYRYLRFWRVLGKLSGAAAGAALLLYGYSQIRRRRGVREAEKRRMEQAVRNAERDADAAKHGRERLIEFLALEVEAPLGGIAGAAVSSSPEGREARDSADKRTEHLLRTISQSLEFARLEMGAAEFQNTAITVRPFLEDICGEFQASASAKGLELKRHVAADVPEGMIGDPARLRQTLRTLVRNAIKATTQGLVEITVMVGPRNQGPNGGASRRSFYFKVRDTGQGLTPEAQKAIFLPYSAPNSGKRQPGVGFGLAIARRTAQLLGGDIRVESRPAKGASFSVEIVAEETAVSEPPQTGALLPAVAAAAKPTVNDAALVG